MPIPLLPKNERLEIKDDPINFHVPDVNEIKSHPSYGKLIAAIKRGNVKKLSEFINGLNFSLIATKQLAWYMLESIMFENPDLGDRAIPYADQMKAVLIKKLPALLFNEHFELAEMKALKAKGVDLSYQYDGLSLLHMTLLHKNSLKERMQSFTWLVDQNICDINSNDEHGGTGTALHVYIANEDFICASGFIDKYKDKLNLTIKDREGKTLLIIASKIGNENIALKLCNLAKDAKTINLQDESGRSALHYACILKLSNLIKELMKKGADINLVDSQGKRPQDYIEDHECISPTLISIEIHPDRDEKAKRNALPLDYKDNETEILATKANGNNEQYKKRLELKDSKSCDDFTERSLLEAIKSRIPQAKAAFIEALQLRTQLAAAAAAPPPPPASPSAGEGGASPRAAGAAGPPASTNAASGSSSSSSGKESSQGDQKTKSAATKKKEPYKQSQSQSSLSPPPTLICKCSTEEEIHIQFFTSKNIIFAEQKNGRIEAKDIVLNSSQLPDGSISLAEVNWTHKQKIDAILKMSGSDYVTLSPAGRIEIDFSKLGIDINPEIDLLLDV